MITVPKYNDYLSLFTISIFTNSKSEKIHRYVGRDSYMVKIALLNPHSFMGKLEEYIQKGETIQKELNTSPNYDTVTNYDSWYEEVDRFLKKYDNEIVEFYSHEFYDEIFIGCIGGNNNLYLEVENRKNKISKKIQILNELRYDFSQKIDNSISTSFATGAVVGGIAATIISKLVGEDSAKQLIEELKKQPRKYQIFISSTFKELEKERSVAINTINRLGHIPRAMEFFPSSCDNSWDYITKILVECDFMLLILGNEYGHTMKDEDGREKSITEMEYEYAIEHKIPVFPIKYIKNENDKIDERQKSFIDKVSSKNQRPTANIESLGAIIAQTLMELGNYNRPGWISWKLFEET